MDNMTSDLNTVMELELGDLLQEFQDVVEELKAPSNSRADSYQHVLKEAKCRTGQCDDSGVEDYDSSSEASLRNSLNNSEEELHTAGIMQAPKAKMETRGAGELYRHKEIEERTIGSGTDDQSRLLQIQSQNTRGRCCRRRQK
ncbi:hypothetical protein WMY93_009813 [Mugilogobius chulae]|uniref:Uncharacterized protein n=1 Tax=Mugilogobius chulae TaxID=88201 RepID=A0AAW0PDY2_9GOBI